MSNSTIQSVDHTQPITSLEEGKVYLDSCIEAGLIWHLEDDPSEIITRLFWPLHGKEGKPLFTPEEIPLVRARVSELYALPSWDEHDCPIGYLWQGYQESIEETPKAQTPPYIVKKFKEWEGMDGMGCRGEIHHPTKGKVADFFDEGCGGEMMVDPKYTSAKVSKQELGRTNLEDMVAYSEFKEFKEWANAHPALALVFKEWGFTPAGDDHTDTLIEVLIAEFRIAKEVKKGYLCYQDPTNAMAFMGAKQGRKKVKYTVETARWIRKELPNCIIRNEASPAWIEGAPEVK